jgi:peptidoglycan/LPS O-acetylase OafA/YrhL
MSNGSSQVTPAGGRPALRGARLPYLPGLDGLRAIAVIAVLLYHAELRWIPGGFLGVEVFFVISGYLITSLLLAEWRAHGRIDLKAFWLRRARRLLPALFLVIAAMLAFAVIFLPDEVAGLRGDTAAAVGYVTNWYLISSQTSYFESVGRPSLLRHLWSLAVEEQFYLLWPVLFALGARWLRPRRLLPLVIAGVAASTALMGLLYQPDADPSRVYYGTDTRASGLLIGVALAFVWAPWHSRSELRRGQARWLDLAGLAALAVMIAFFLRLDEFRPFLYQGGFAALALATLIAIAAVVHPQTQLGPALLGRPLLRWIGLRSYGIYLWHWPVFMVTRPQLDIAMDELPLLALRLAATLILAELSYQHLEMPVRNGALGRAWRAWRAPGEMPRWQVGARWAGAGGIVLAFSVLGVSVVGAHPPAPPSYLAVAEIHIAPAPPTPSPLPTIAFTRAATRTPTPTDTPTATPTRIATLAGAAALSGLMKAEDLAALPNLPPTPSATPPVATPRPTPVVLPTQPTSPLPSPGATQGVMAQILAIGDSVMISAADELQRALDGVEIDAKLGRQVSATLRLLRERRDAGRLPRIVVIHVGNNGTFTAEQFDSIMAVLAGVPRVVFVNVKVTHRWEEPNNSVLADGVGRYRNAVLVDWHAASVERPELFWSDGIHLRPEGAHAYTELIAAAVKQGSIVGAVVP